MIVPTERELLFSFSWPGEQAIMEWNAILCEWGCSLTKMERRLVLICHCINSIIDEKSSKAGKHHRHSVKLQSESDFDRERNCGLHFWGRKQLLKGEQQSKCVTGPVDFSYPFAVISVQMNIWEEGGTSVLKFTSTRQRSSTVSWAKTNHFAQARLSAAAFLSTKSRGGG